ncbi:hypothetical protein [Sphingorhabdus sp.]|jgi:L-asparagine transporter-like permease
MSATKIIAIVVLLVVGAHLLLYGFLKRKIDAAKAEKGMTDD